MLRWSVQRIEVVGGELHLGTFSELVAHTDEDVDDLPDRPGKRVQSTDLRPITRKGDVDTILGPASPRFCRLELFAFGGDGRFERLMYLIGEPAEFGTFFVGGLTQCRPR